MAVESTVKVSSKDMKIEDLNEFSNIFASQFNNSDIHDRVLCFEVIIKDEESEKEVDSEDNESGTESDERSLSPPRFSDLEYPTKCEHENEIDEKNQVDDIETYERAESGKKQDACVIHEASKSDEPSYVHEKDEDQQNDPRKEESPNEEAEGSDKDGEEKMCTIIDDGNQSSVSKLFVHSQWLSVQSSYFKALFYSGMKESYSKEVIMKINEDELEAHLVLIEAMYKLDVLNNKDYCLIAEVLILAHKYDVSLVVKKCKYVLIDTAPSLEMCEYILQKTEHLTKMADVNDMLQTFLVNEFTPIDKTWTTEKFTGLSKAALKLLLKSDNLSTQSENTIFVALMKWVQSNIPCIARSSCDLLHLVRFEFLSVDFLYDVVQNHNVARRMPGFNKYLLNGLAYHCFSEIRQEQLEPKPKKRLSTEEIGPTFSWVIGEKLDEKLTNSPGVNSYSDKFWHKGYQMQLRLNYLKDLNKCAFYLAVCNLKGKACLYLSYRAKSNLFASNTIQTAKRLFTAGTNSAWGYRSIARNVFQRGKGYTIDIWVDIEQCCK